MLCVFVIIICSESLPDRLKTLKVEVLEKHRGEIKVCCDIAPFIIMKIITLDYKL